MTPEAMARLEQIGPECVAVACDALLARLRRIHRAVDDAPSDAEALRREAARAHVAHAEALLNLLTVLREMGGARAPDPGGARRAAGARGLRVPRA